MNLSKNFILKEFTATNTGLDNTPTPEVIANLQQLCVSVLQPLRDKYGKSITINSGYRCSAVNKAVGGAANSQHLTGEAVDITAGSKEENKKLFTILEKMNFDQLIDEKNMTWVHVSYKSHGNRNQKLKL